MKQFTVSPYYEALFWPKVVKTPEHYLWIASLDAYGYGQFNIKVDGKRRMVKAHHVAWWLEHRSWPDDTTLELDHTCEFKSCVRPLCMEWVTPTKNKERVGERKDYCWSGKHRWDEQTPIIENGYRRCRLCVYERNAKYYQSKSQGV